MPRRRGVGTARLEVGRRRCVVSRARACVIVVAFAVVFVVLDA